MYKSLAEAMALVQPGDHLFIQTGAAAPQFLIKGLMERALRLQDITIYQMHTEGAAPYGDPEWQHVFKTNCFFIGKNLRKAVQAGRADYIPVFLSEIPSLFRSRALHVDVALIHVSVPDKNGYCSLGVSVDIAPAVLENAVTVIAQVNPNMPRTYGDALIHVSRISTMVACQDPMLTTKAEEGDEGTTSRIALNVASLIEDGSTLQMGIGKIPNAVLKNLHGHRRLGIHTEMFSDGVVELIESGAVTGEMKKKRRYKVVSSFMIGSRKLYDFANDNPVIEMLDIGYVNDVHIIRQNPKVIAINCAIEIDLSGQVCADSIGSRMYSGVGGQMDFMRGASLSEGGKPIIAIPSVTSRGESKIVPFLKPGAGVVTSRANVHYIVTEYGIAFLYGKNLTERAKALIGIAHPSHREKLQEAFFNLKNSSDTIIPQAEQLQFPG